MVIIVASNAKDGWWDDVSAKPIKRVTTREVEGGSGSYLPGLLSGLLSGLSDGFSGSSSMWSGLSWTTSSDSLSWSCGCGWGPSISSSSSSSVSVVVVIVVVVVVSVIDGMRWDGRWGVVRCGEESWVVWWELRCEVCCKVGKNIWD